MVLDLVRQADEEAASAYVDDLKMRFGSPWSLPLGCEALGRGAAHSGKVYECGVAGKTTVILEGITAAAANLAPLRVNATTQHGTPRILGPLDDNTFLGVPDGVPPLRADGAPHASPGPANQAVRHRVLRKVSQFAAVALRVPAVHALRSSCVCSTGPPVLPGQSCGEGCLHPSICALFADCWRQSCQHPGPLCNHRRANLVPHNESTSHSAEAAVCRPWLGVPLDHVQNFSSCSVREVWG